MQCRLFRVSRLLAICFTLVSCLACSSTLKMEVACSSEMSVDFQRTAWRYIPEPPQLPLWAPRIVHIWFVSTVLKYFAIFSKDLLSLSYDFVLLFEEATYISLVFSMFNPRLSSILVSDGTHLFWLWFMFSPNDAAALSSLVTVIILMYIFRWCIVKWPTNNHQFGKYGCAV
jgi:hypothetical protein